MKRLFICFISLVIVFSFVSTCFAASSVANLDPNNFPGMTITYTSEGIPVVDDPTAIPNPMLRAVTAIIISPYGFFYSDSSLDDKYLLFSIPKGKVVTVIDSDMSTNVAKIEYAGYTGYIRKSNLKI